MCTRFIRSIPIDARSLLVCFVVSSKSLSPLFWHCCDCYGFVLMYDVHWERQVESSASDGLSFSRPTLLGCFISHCWLPFPFAFLPTTASIPPTRTLSRSITTVRFSPTSSLDESSQRISCLGGLGKADSARS